MTKINLFIVGFAIGFGTVWEAQAQEYTIKLAPAEVDIISDGLQTQPFGKVYPLINKLRTQILEQQQKQPDPPKPAVEPPK